MLGLISGYWYVLEAPTSEWKNAFLILDSKDYPYHHNHSSKIDSIASSTDNHNFK